MRWDNIQKIYGWLTKKEAELLYETACDCQGNILEIGSFVGRATAVLAESGNPVITTDMFPNNQLTDFWKNIDSLKLTNITTIKCDHHYLPDFLTGRFKMVYVDGNHIASRIIPDLNFAYYLIDKGYIAIHDYNNKGWPDVKICVDVLLQQWGLKIHKQAGTLIILRK